MHMSVLLKKVILSAFRELVYKEIFRMQKPATTQTPIHDLIANRWSPVGFDANKLVTQVQIMSMLEAARWAPSCYGDQPWRFIVADKSTNELAWQTAFDCIVPGNQKWAQNAPLFILVCADTQFSHNDKPNRWSGYDTGAAVMSLSVQATSLGLFAHQMGGFDGDKARTLFNIPGQIDLMAMVAIGHGVDADSLPDELKQRQLSERTRKDLGAMFFDGIWDKPII